MWMIRAGEKGRLIEEFKNKKIVAIGFNELGDLKNVIKIDELKDKLRRTYLEKNELAIGINAGQIYNFIYSIKEGDLIISYDPINRIYHIGEIQGEYEFNEDICEYHHIRKTEWNDKVLRDNLSITTKNALGAWQTVFSLKKDEKEEIISLLEGEKPEESEETLDNIMEDILEKAHEFIKDKILNLDWKEMQDLIAGILRAMGYKTLITGIGADRGKDIIASTDGLGIKDPKIMVEVKHRSGTIGAPDIQKFLGGLRPGQKGLYVSTGGFSKEAKYEEDRSNVPITLIDSDMIVSLITQYYDNFDIDTKALIPLKKLYWPA